MQKFRDANGKEWKIKIDGPTIQQLRRDTLKELGQEIDLADDEGKSYDLLVEDPITLVVVLAMLCEEQRKSDGVTAKQFGEALVGDCIDDATKALLEAIKDFFPLRRRTLIGASAAKQEKLREIGYQAALATLNDDALDAQLTKALEDRIQSEIKDALMRLSNVTAWQDSSESALAV